MAGITGFPGCPCTLKDNNDNALFEMAKKYVPNVNKDSLKWAYTLRFPRIGSKGVRDDMSL